MTGPEKAVLIIALAVIALVAFNWALWRRMKGALRTRREWSEADFLQSLEDHGCSPRIATLVLELVRPYYFAGVAPQRQDSFVRFLKIDKDEVEGLVEQAWHHLQLSRPTSFNPERIPMLETVNDMAVFLDRRYRELSPPGAGSVE